MITVQLNKTGFEYDIHSLVKAFFPSEDVSVTVSKERAMEEALFRIVTEYRENEIEVSFFSSDAQVQEPFLKQTAEVDFSDRKETKNRLKQICYKMLSEYTGRTLPWGNLTGIRPTKIPMAFLNAGKSEAFIRDYMKETYFASDEKIRLSIDIAKREKELLSKLDYENGYSLYIGIPFCPSTCLYCSFTSYPLGIWEKRVDEYLLALEKEIAFVAKRFGNRHLNTVYIGGGTPTTLKPAQLNRLIRYLKQNLDFSYCREFTVEAGRPDSITGEKLAVLKEQNVSRISINPQTMNEKTLRLIGRNHTAEQTVESFHLARELGFDNINMDLIIGLPNETDQDVNHTMQCIAELCPDNLTVHSLALKRAARLSMFREEYRDLVFESTEKTVGLTAGYAKRMGMEPYYLYRQKNMAGNFENVGYAAPGKAGIYNILIMEEKQSIIACGAGSISKRVHSDGRIERCENVKDVALYIEKIDEMIERKRKLLADESVKLKRLASEVRQR